MVNDPILVSLVVTLVLNEALGAVNDPDIPAAVNGDATLVNCEPSPTKYAAEAVLANIMSPVSNEADIVVKILPLPIRS